MPNGTCSVVDCDRPVLARGWCSRCYQRWSQWGDPMGRPARQCARTGCTYWFTPVANATKYCSSECSGSALVDQRQKWWNEHPEMVAQYRQRRVRRSPQTVQAERERFNLKKYGLTPQAFADILEAQGGRCAICRSDKPGGKGRFHVDHDHASGLVRGLLCNGCNVGLGHYGDDPARLRAAADYLETR